MNPICRAKARVFKNYYRLRLKKSRVRAAPQALKRDLGLAAYGTTQVVPFPVVLM